MNLWTSHARADPVDVDALAGDPRSLAEIGDRERARGYTGSRGAGRCQPLLEAEDQPIDGLASCGAEEVDGRDVGDAFPEARERAGGLGPRLFREIARARRERFVREPPDVGTDGPVVRLASTREERAQRLVVETVDEASLAERRVATFLADLLQHPLEVFAARLRCSAARRPSS